MTHSIAGGRKSRCRGTEIIEFSLILFPFLGLLFLTLDMGWAFYCRSTLQHAAREGCRYAITSQTGTDKSGAVYGQIDSIKQVTQVAAMGFLGGKPTDPGWSLVQVNFYDPKDLATPLTPPTAAKPTAINVYPNIVEVTISNFPLKPLLPLYRSPVPLNLGARSADRMESSPSTGAPKYGTGTTF